MKNSIIRTKQLLIFASLIFSIGGAKAGEAGVSRRERQRERIDNGVADGTLTKNEEKRLDNQMQKIRDFRNGARADGSVNDAEQAAIKALRDQQSERIFAEKHDKQMKQGEHFREIRQQDRIEAGVAQGDLNRREARRLNKRMEILTEKRTEARADGVVTNEERVAITQRRDSLSQSIYNQRHDAQTAANQLSRRQMQRNRIEQGVASGELNRREAERLNNQMQAIRDVRQGALADGSINAEEQALLQHKRDVLSGHIYNEKHDAQKSEPLIDESLISSQPGRVVGSHR